MQNVSLISAGFREHEHHAHWLNILVTPPLAATSLVTPPLAATSLVTPLLAATSLVTPPLAAISLVTPPLAATSQRAKTHEKCYHTPKKNTGT